MCFIATVVLTVAVITRITSMICLRNSILNHVNPVNIDDLQIVKDGKHMTFKLIMKHQNITSLM